MKYMLSAQIFEKGFIAKGLTALTKDKLFKTIFSVPIIPEFLYTIRHQYDTTISTTTTTTTTTTTFSTSTFNSTYEETTVDYDAPFDILVGGNGDDSSDIDDDDKMSPQQRLNYNNIIAIIAKSILRKELLKPFDNCSIYLCMYIFFKKCKKAKN